MFSHYSLTLVEFPSNFLLFMLWASVSFFHFRVDASLMYSYLTQDGTVLIFINIFLILIALRYIEAAQYLKILIPVRPDEIKL